MKKIIYLLLFFPIASYSQVISITDSNDKLRFANTISKKDLKTHVYILASDSMEGRETGKPGQKMAANYIADFFKSIGISPYKRNTYFQKFKVQSGRHYCKCSTCDSKFLKDLFKSPNDVRGENVLGFIEGTDLKDEILIITAHYDHLGMHNGEIFNGADDDASGTSAALEIAQAFMEAKKVGKGPRRSVLIMPVSGEEKGL